MPTNGAIAQVLVDIISAFVAVVLGPSTSPSGGGSADAQPANVDEPEALPDSQTLVARIQAWRASGASMMSVATPAPAPAPAVAPARAQNGGVPVAAPSAEAETSSASSPPSAEHASPTVSGAPFTPSPVPATGDATSATAAPVTSAAPMTASSAAPSTTAPAAAAVTTPLQGTPADLVAVPGQPGTFVSRSAFAQLEVDREPPGTPLPAMTLADSPARSGSVDSAAMTALLTSQGVDRTPPAAATVANDLPQSPALSGRVDAQQIAALGLPTTRDADALTAAWSNLPPVPIVMQTAAPSHAAAAGAAAAPSTPTAAGIAADASEPADDTRWPSLPEWPLPSDDAGADRGSLRDRMESSWYV